MAKETTAEKLDLNKCTKEDLMQIEGVGQSTAENIIKYRESRGGIKNLKELDSIPRISQVMLEKIRQGSRV